MVWSVARSDCQSAHAPLDSSAADAIAGASDSASNSTVVVLSQ